MASLITHAYWGIHWTPIEWKRQQAHHQTSWCHAKSPTAQSILMCHEWRGTIQTTVPWCDTRARSVILVAVTAACVCVATGRSPWINAMWLRSSDNRWRTHTAVRKPDGKSEEASRHACAWRTDEYFWHGNLPSKGGIMRNCKEGMWWSYITDSVIINPIQNDAGIRMRFEKTIYWNKRHTDLSLTHKDETLLSLEGSCWDVLPVAVSIFAENVISKVLLL